MRGRRQRRNAHHHRQPTARTTRPHATDGTTLLDSPCRPVASALRGGAFTFLPLITVGGRWGFELSFRSSLACTMSRSAAEYRGLQVVRVSCASRVLATTP